MDFTKPINVKDAVQVAVNIRPLIGSELVQGCRDCITVIPGEPQVQLGSHCFTFDHVYGTNGSPSSGIFLDCVAPLVDGLFYGYNATVLAYGQTGSGKTFTMGTGYTPGGNNGGVIPQVMETIFNKVNCVKDKAIFQIRVSFIEILKEEIHDLLDPSTVKSEIFNASGIKTLLQAKPVIQIRENTAGGISLAGITETDVNCLQDMATCLAQGSLSRATGSTNMNTHSSRSHAIFTITLEQRRKAGRLPGSDTDDTCDEFLCGKLHLVDLAGSERAKRTGTDGMRFKEGVHINRGLLALGNVISALGEDKKRKEPRHVPYRDSKLTRLLQDSLGGNSRTIMIACVSPADSNAEETLNTLKYANRARNIQNKPIVNRDPVGVEMQKLRQQLDLLQAELIFAKANEASAGIEAIKQKLACAEATNEALRRELQESEEICRRLSQRALEAQVERDKLTLQIEQMLSGKAALDAEENATKTESLLQSYLGRIRDLECELQQLQNFRPKSRSESSVSCINPEHSSETSDMGGVCSDAADTLVDYSGPSCENESEVDSVAAKELEHHLFIRDCMDKELHELNQQLKQKEEEMKSFATTDTVILKQHFERKLVELETEKKSLQMEKNTLCAELEALFSSSDEQTKKIQQNYVQKLKDLETQILDLKKQQDKQAQLLKSKQRSDEAARQLHNEIHRMKQQKVQLQIKIKQESEQFRNWKACREKELLQLRKEGRRNEYEMHKLQVLHQRQKLVLHRKTEEAAAVTRRLKEVLEARKASSRESVYVPGSTKLNSKTFQQWFDVELAAAVRLREVKVSYEKQQLLSEEMLSKELSSLKEDEESSPNSSENSSRLENESEHSKSRDADCISSQIDSLERSISATCTMLATPSDDDPKAHMRWQQVRTLGNAKELLNFVFNVAACARCQLRDIENENKELKDKINLLNDDLRLSECHRKDLEQFKSQVVSIALATASKVGGSSGQSVADLLEYSQLGVLGAMQLCYEERSASFSNPSSSENLGLDIQQARHSMSSNQEGTAGKASKWKRSQQRWSLQFKWKWQKPWRIAHWTRQNDKAITRINNPPTTVLSVLDML